MPRRDHTRTLALLAAILLAGEVRHQAAEGGPGGNDRVQEPGKYALMDHGPFYTGTVVQPGDGCTNKGIVITLDQQHRALAVFDPELLRFSFAATGASIIHPTARDGLEGQPRVAGEAVFAALAATGWARPGSDDFTDPRDKQQSDQPLGNLPKDWAAYHGLYLSGTTVVLSYSVGPAEVLEVPALVADASTVAVSRSLTLTGNAQPLALLVAEQKGGQASVEDGVGLITGEGGLVAAGVIGGGQLKAAGQRLTLAIPASTALLRLLVWHGERSGLDGFRKLLAVTTVPSDAHALTRGGPGRWGGALERAGEVGPDRGPYTIDTITVPYENPARSYMRLSGHDFFADGRAAVCTLDGDVWIVSGIDRTLPRVSWRRFATGLFQPMGLRIVDGLVYVLCRDRLVRLHDLDGDGEADFYENFNGDCPVTRYYHEFTMDLVTDREGNFYYNKGSNLGEAADSAQGCVLKVSRDGTQLTRFCSGMREANGMGGGDGHPLLNSDNQGNWTPVDRINQLKEGGFYGFMGAAHREPKPAAYDPPLIWLHYPLENSAGGLAYVDDDRWGPFKDRPVGLSYGKASMFVLLPEEVDGVPQAGAVFLPLTFASGAMRARFNARDGQLYVTGLRGWQTSGAREGAFQRVRWTGRPAYLPCALHVREGAIAIGFDQPLDPATAGDADNYAIECWNYRYTSAYGSKDWKVSEPAKEGHDTLAVTRAELSPDRRQVTLTIAGLQPVMQMRTRYNIAAADGTPVSGELYQTINRIGRR